MVDVKDRWALSYTEKVLTEIRAKGVAAYAVAAELSDLDSVKAMLGEIDRKGNRVDIVMNNAGMQITYHTDYFKTPVEDYTESFKINTIAPAMICYHFMPSGNNSIISCSW